MKPFPTDHLEKLVEEKNWNAVKALFEEWVSGDMDGEELLTVTRAYMRLKTKLNKDYLDELETISGLAKQMEVVGKKFEDDEKVSGLKGKIKDL